MRLSLAATVVAASLALALAGCKDEKTAEAPKPVEPVADSIAHFCNMPVLDHPGPKGEIFLKGKAEPVWFASARDTIAFTKLPEEPKEIAAIYVSDMGKAEGWLKPEPGGWVDAHAAWFVVRRRHGRPRGGALREGSRRRPLCRALRRPSRAACRRAGGIRTGPRPWLLGAGGGSGAHSCPPHALMGHAS